MDVFDKIYQNRIIFDILENENKIGFKSFNCYYEYVLREYPFDNETNIEYTFYCNCNGYCYINGYDYQSSSEYPRATHALTHQPIIITNITDNEIETINVIYCTFGVCLWENNNDHKIISGMSIYSICFCYCKFFVCFGFVLAVTTLEAPLAVATQLIIVDVF